MRGRRALWRRTQAQRAGAAALVGLGVWAGLEAVLPGRSGDATAVVVTSDLAPGHTLTASDVDVVHVDPALLPPSAVTDPQAAAGVTLGQSVGRGETLTQARLRPARTLSGLPAGHRAVHVPVADPGSTALVRAGDRVDVVAVDTGTLVGSGLLVLSVDAPTTTGGLGGGTSAASGLVLAVPAGAMARLVPAAARPSGDGIHVALRPDIAKENPNGT